MANPEDSHIRAGLIRVLTCYNPYEHLVHLVLTVAGQPMFRRSLAAKPSGLILFQTGSRTRLAIVCPQATTKEGYG